MIAVSLLGRSLVLRPMTIDDAEAMYRIHSDPRVSRYTSAKPAHGDIDETRGMIIRLMQNDGAGVWMMADRQAPLCQDRSFGWVGLFRTREGVADVTINLRRDAQNMRRAREAMVCILEHAFTTLGYHRVGADIDIDNTGCVKLAEAVGFRYEGRLRDYWHTTLGWRDSLIYGILHHDYTALRPSLIRRINHLPGQA